MFLGQPQILVWISVLCLKSVCGQEIRLEQVTDLECTDEDRTYRVGQTWTSSKNNCSLNKCVQDVKGSIVIERAMCTAVKVPVGCEFHKDVNLSFPDCCGTYVCDPTVCEDGGRTYRVGQKWKSAKNFCSLNECVKDRQGNVVTKRASCMRLVPRPGCHVTGYDRSKEFPYCCPVQRCVNNTQTCTYHGRTYRVGQNFTLSNKPCSVYMCARATEGTTVKAAQCVPPPTGQRCTVYKGDPSKPFPRCCDTYSCIKDGMHEAPPELQVPVRIRQ